jgi:transposase
MIGAHGLLLGMRMILEILRCMLRKAGKRMTAWAWIGRRIGVTASSMVKSASCPACGQRSRKRHGRNWRRLAEGPCFSHSVSIEVEVRRFRRANEACPRQTFAEPITPLAAPRQRCTTGLARARRAIGLALGGRADARHNPFDPQAQPAPDYEFDQRIAW